MPLRWNEQMMLCLRGKKFKQRVPPCVCCSWLLWSYSELMDSTLKVWEARLCWQEEALGTQHPKLRKDACYLRCIYIQSIDHSKMFNDAGAAPDLLLGATEEPGEHESLQQKLRRRCIEKTSSSSAYLDSRRYGSYVFTNKNGFSGWAVRTVHVFA